MNGCLVVHGLTGTPATAVSLRDELLRAGFRVAMPCLAGHGVSVDELAASGWQDWYDTVRTAFAELRRDCDKVYYAGSSLGALLGLMLAIDEGWGVRAMALLATPLKFSGFVNLALPLVRYTPLRWLIRSFPKDFERSVADPDGRRRYEDFSLPEIPASSVYEIADLQRRIMQEISRVTSPILLMHGRDDTVAPLSNIELVKKSVGSDIVESIIFERSRHVITMDSEKDAVAREAAGFFERFA